MRARGRPLGLLLLSVALRPLGAQAPAPDGVTLFCFAAVVPGSYQADLIAAQFMDGAGMFGCAKHLIISNASSDAVFGRHLARQLSFQEVDGPLQAFLDPESELADANFAEAHRGFIQVWQQVLRDGSFEEFDWTVKVDADAVFLPGSLQAMLARRCTPPSECPAVFLEDGGSERAPVEVISKAAARLFAQTSEWCAEKLPADLSKAKFLSSCMKLLSVRAVSEPKLLMRVEPGGGCRPEFAAFHPFRSWGAALQCSEEAGQSVSELLSEASQHSHRHISASKAGDPTLLCVAMVRLGATASLIAKQHVKGVGVFSCDGYQLFSTASAEELFVEEVLNGTLLAERLPRVSPLRTLADGGEEVLKELLTSGRFRDFDWTVVVQPDAVLLPNKLRELLWARCPVKGAPCGPAYVRSGSAGAPVEAVSRQAMQVLDGSPHRCGADVLSDSGLPNLVGQARRCAELSKVPAFEEAELVRDLGEDAHRAASCDSSAAAFYPLEHWGAQLKCLKHATEAAETMGRRWRLPEHSRSPSMFCWSLVRPMGPEAALLLRLRQEGLGIFACDDHLVISNLSTQDLFGSMSDHVSSDIMQVPLESPSFGPYGIVLNTVLFLKAWNRVFKDGRFRQHDWTVKADADAVLVPGRVRQLLRRHCWEDRECGPKFLANFGRDLHGSLEALSRRAAELLADGVGRCVSNIDFSDKGEDRYLSMCLDVLGARAEGEPGLLSGRHDDHGGSCDEVHAAFHPFKRWEGYVECLCETGLDSGLCKSPPDALVGPAEQEEDPASRMPESTPEVTQVTSTTSWTLSVLPASSEAEASARVSTSPHEEGQMPDLVGAEEASLMTSSSATTTAPLIAWLQEDAPHRHRGLASGRAVSPPARPQPLGGSVASAGALLATAVALAALAAWAGWRQTRRPVAAQVSALFLEARSVAPTVRYEAQLPKVGDAFVHEEPAE